MIWMDYNIEQLPDGSLDIKGDEPMEVMKKGMFKPGDVFVVTNNGVLRKLEDVEAFVRAGKEA
jgi:hypothetical protein